MPGQAPVPLTIFRSNLKFDQNLQGWFKMYSTNPNEILHTSRQWYCRGACKISLWSATCVLNWRTPNFGRIANSNEISLVGRAPDQVQWCRTWHATISWGAASTAGSPRVSLDVFGACCRAAIAEALSRYPAFKSSLCDSFENWPTVDEIYGGLIFAWVAVTWIDSWHIVAKWRHMAM